MYTITVRGVDTDFREQEIMITEKGWKSFKKSLALVYEWLRNKVDENMGKLVMSIHHDKASIEIYDTDVNKLIEITNPLGGGTSTLEKILTLSDDSDDGDRDEE